jgi:hypothetical protein
MLIYSMFMCMFAVLVGLPGEEHADNGDHHSEVTTPMMICRFVLRPPLPPSEGVVDEFVGVGSVVVRLAVGWTLVA